MLKKWLSLLLAALMLLALAPAALASSEDFVKNSGDSDADIYTAIGDDAPAGKLAAGAQKKLLGTEKSGDDTWYKIEGGYVKKGGGVAVVTVLTAELVAAGASVPYGETAKVTAQVKNGEGYKIEYSVEGGAWTETVPTRTEPGKVNVKVRATKDGADTLTADVTLEVGAKPSVKTTLTVHGGTFAYDGKPHAASYTLENGEGYTVRYTTDDGKTWKSWNSDKDAPNLTKVGKLTVKVEAAKSGAETLTVTVKLEVTNAAADGSTVTIVNCKSWVNVREKATSSSKKLGTAKKGKTFKLLAVEGKWYKIQYTSGKVGYVFHSYVKVGSGTAPAPDPDPTPISGDKGYIVNCHTCVNVRKKASSNSTKLGTLNKGTEVTITGVSGKWTRIAYKGGVAYVFSYYVSGSKPDDDVVGKKGTIVNCNSWVNVREKANSSSKKLGTAKKGATYTVKGLSGNWVQVDYDGKTAFIYKRYVKIG